MLHEPNFTTPRNEEKNIFLESFQKFLMEQMVLGFEL